MDSVVAIFGAIVLGMWVLIVIRPMSFWGHRCSRCEVPRPRSGEGFSGRKTIDPTKVRAPRGPSGVSRDGDLTCIRGKKRDGKLRFPRATSGVHRPHPDEGIRGPVSDTSLSEVRFPEGASGVSRWTERCRHGLRIHCVGCRGDAEFERRRAIVRGMEEGER